MDDYNRYVTAVNKIFDYTEKMKAGWNNMDNRNYIDSIDEYKSVVTAKADAIKKPPTMKVEKAEGEEDETLSLDVGEAPAEKLGGDSPAKEEEAPSEIRSFAPSNQSHPASGGITDIANMGGFPGIKEAPKIPVMEAVPLPK